MAGESIRFNASLNTAGFDSGAARLQQVAGQASSKVSASFASMGASIARVIAPFVGLYAAINSVKNALDLGGRLNDLSKTTGESAGNLAILQRAFENTGVGADRVGTSIQKMSEFIVGLQQGSPAAAKAADALGVSMADLAGKTPIQQMQTLMGALAGITDPALRSATAVDVFGKAGRDIVPLAQEFGGAMAEARSELGSLPRILDENAASLDQLGDKLTNAVGNKLTEVAVGLAAGVTGANNFADALAKIDAAGFGERLGQTLKTIFDAPKESAKAVGFFLLEGIAKAGNALDAAFRYAIETYYKMLDNPGFYDGLGMYLEGVFAKVGETFFSTLLEGFKTVLGAMDWNPLWRPFTNMAKEALDGLTSDIKQAGEAAAVSMGQGALQMKAAFNGATDDAKYIYQDIFGAADYSKQAADHWAAAQDASAAISQNSSDTAANFATGSKAITDALAEIRGFSLGEGDSETKPDWLKSSSPAPSFQYGGNGGGGGGGGGLGPSVSGAPMSENMRVAELRGSARQSVRDQRASQLAAAGMFRSAIRAQDAGQRAYDRAMESAQLRDIYSNIDVDGKSGGASNIGEAMKGLIDQAGGKMPFLDELRKSEKDSAGNEIYKYDPKKSLEENLKDALKDTDKFNPKDQAKTPEERKQEEEEARNRSRPPGGGGDQKQGKEQQTEGKLDKIISIMEERLPIRVIAKAA
jgi:hypothetical protein